MCRNSSVSDFLFSPILPIATIKQKREERVPPTLQEFFDRSSFFSYSGQKRKSKKKRRLMLPPLLTHTFPIFRGVYFPLRRFRNRRRYQQLRYGRMDPFFGGLSGSEANRTRFPFLFSGVRGGSQFFPPPVTFPVYVCETASQHFPEISKESFPRKGKYWTILISCHLPDIPCMSFSRK